MRQRQLAFAVVALCGIAVVVGVSTPATEPGFFEWCVRAAGDPDRGYVLSVIYEEPTFSEVRFMNGNPVMFVDGREFDSQADLIASFGHGIGGPVTVVLNRENYEATTGGAIMPQNDEDLWHLCIETARRSN